jgi:hypothetical protein
MGLGCMRKEISRDEFTFVPSAVETVMLSQYDEVGADRRSEDGEMAGLS